MPILLSLFFLAAKLWMLFDARRRQVEFFWVIIILLVPFGEWIYFLVFKARDFNIKPAAAEHSAEEPQLGLEQLRHAVSDSPSFDNRMRLAAALYEAEQFAEAEQYFEQALSTHRTDREALYGLGLSRLAQGKLDEAVETLSRLLDLNLGFADYEAAFDLVQALWKADRRAEAFELLEEITAHSPRVRHRLMLARYLLDDGQPNAAVHVLEEALDTFQKSPDFTRKREGRWATEARRMLEALRESPET